MKRNLLLFFSLVMLASMVVAQPLPQGNRTLAWQIDMTQNNNFDSALAYGACMESIHLPSLWSDIEPDTGVFDASFIANFFDVINIFFPPMNVSVELQIAPVNTGLKAVPTEFTNLPFNDPRVINRFKIVLDTVFAHIPNVTLSALNIGNEGDINFGTDSIKYYEYKVFLDSVAAYAKNLYFNLHGTNLNVGTTFTWKGLTDNPTSNLCKSVNDGRDIVATTYYPLNNDFTMKPPNVVSNDFASLVAIYPDTTQPIYFVECGYASSTVCNSSEALQAQFWTEVFTAWDTYNANIKYLTIFKSTDWSIAEVNQLALEFGIQDTIFKEYLRTLGLRTWNGDGTSKQAYDQVLCELDSRNWCAVSCMLTSVAEQFSPIELLTYPNPAKKSVIFQFKNPISQNYTIRLFDIQGSEVRKMSDIKNERIEMEIGDLTSGIYFYQISSKKGVNQNGKLIFE